MALSTAPAAAVAEALGSNNSPESSSSVPAPAEGATTETVGAIATPPSGASSAQTAKSVDSSAAAGDTNESKAGSILAQEYFLVPPLAEGATSETTALAAAAAEALGSNGSPLSSSSVPAPAEGATPEAVGATVTPSLETSPAQAAVSVGSSAAVGETNGSKTDSPSILCCGLGYRTSTREAQASEVKIFAQESSLVPPSRRAQPRRPPRSPLGC